MARKISRWSVSRIAALAALIPVLTLGVLFATSGVASAHAAFVSSNPAPNAVLKEAPGTVTITFAEEVKPSDSAIVIYDSSMKQVSTGNATADPSNLKKMSVPMKGDDSEVYVVVWHNVSADDGDPDAGSFVFNIGTAPSGSNGNGGSSPAASSNAGGVPVWATVLVGVLGLVVGGAGTALALRRNPAAN